MDSLFAPPDAAWQRVSPALVRMRRTVLLVTLGLLMVILVAIEIVLDLPGWTWVAGVALLVAVGGCAWWLIGRNAARWGYAELEDELFVTRGALFRRLVVVPYGRMQFVDVQSGPLARSFGFATVTLHTASTSTAAAIPGVPLDEAQRLRDRLAQLGEGHGAGV